MTSANTKQPSMFSVFRNRNFSLMFASDTISEFGTGITSIAASILVFRETGSALSVGLMLMATALPGLFFGLIAGVYVDRLDRKRIMLASEILRMVIIAAIPFLITYGIWWLYLLVMLASTVKQFFEPAHASVLPDIATDEELAPANSFLAASQMGALGLGFAVAGIISGRFSVDLAFYIDAATFLLSAVFIFFVQIPKTEVADSGTVSNVVGNLREGWRFLWDSPTLRSLLFVSTAIGILFGLNNALLLPFADRALQATETEYGLIEAFSMVGFVVGSLWMARVAERLREGQWLALSYLGMGAVSVVYSQIDSISIAIALGLVSTFANVPSFLAGRLIRQRHTTSEIRGRVTSVFIVVIETTFMIGMGLAGLADLFDIRMMFLLQGLLLVGVGLIVLVLPGLGQPASEWKQAIALLRGVANAPGLSTGRSATMGDIEMFAARLPAVASLKTAEKQKLITGMRYLEADVGTVIMRHHEISDSAYFILEGRAFAGRTENGEETVLEVLNAGAFFGEIAALTGIPRTANIVVEQPAVLLQVPAATLREMAAIPEMNRVFMSKMTERMIRMNMLDTPKALGLDQNLARELRTEDPTSATIPPFVSSVAQSFS